MPAKQGLRRVLGIPGLLFYGVGLILGAGIYSILGPAAGVAREGLWASFALGALAAALTGLSYAELATMFPRAGADYVYAREAFPRFRLLPPVVGLSLAASGLATAATVAVAFAGYLRVFLDVEVLLAASGLLVIVTALNIWGIRESSWANAVMTLVEAGGLLFVVTLAFTHADVSRGVGVPSMDGLFAGAAMIFFAFLGFQEIANLAEESRDPGRAMPRALLWSIAVSAVLYTLVAISAVALLPPEELAQSDSPLAAAVDTVDARYGLALAAVALFATANTALVALIASSRMLLGIARGGDLPPFVGHLVPSRRTPWVAGLLLLALSIALVPAGELEVLGGVASLLALSAFVVLNASLVRLRWTRPDAKRPFRVPWRLGRVPVLPVAGALVSLGLMTQLPPATYALAAVLLLVILAALAARRASQRRSG